MDDIEFFFDCSCVWAWFALAYYDRAVARHGLPLRLRPVTMDVVLHTVNRAALEPEAAVRSRYFAAEIGEWTHFLGLALADPVPQPPASHRCMRACAAAGYHGRLPEFAGAAFAALWQDGRDLDSPLVLTELWTHLGLPASLLAQELDAPGPARQLDADTRELMERGGFGVPTFCFGGQLYFGADSVPLLERAVRRRLRAI